MMQEMHCKLLDCPEPIYQPFQIGLNTSLYHWDYYPLIRSTLYLPDMQRKC